jgi:hypothetical protein
MSRSLYLRQIAAPQRTAGGVMRLTPPRVLFRPSPAPPGFTVIEEHTADRETPRHVALPVGKPNVSLLSPEPIPTLPEMSANLIRPTTPPPLLRPAREITATTAAERAPSPQPAVTDRRSPSPTRIPAATDHLDVPRVVIHPRRPLETPIPVAVTPSVIAQPAADEPSDQHTEAPRHETQSVPRGKPTAPVHSVPEPKLPQGPPSPIADLRARPTAAPGARSEAPEARQRPAHLTPAPPLFISPRVPPAPAPRTSLADRASPAVHIGALEIRVVAPAAASRPVAPLSAHSPVRPAPRITSRATDTNRLARGFGAFGLSQA